MAEGKVATALRRNFLINPYGNASIQYGATKIFNNLADNGEELVRRTRDDRFLLTANPKGTLSVWPLVDTPCYRIAVETRQAVVAQIVVRGPITQVPPNYEISQGGVCMKMLNSETPEPIHAPSGVPTLTLMLHDDVEARRIDFRNGKEKHDHWVTVVALTTKSSGHRRPIYDRVLRVGYNGHYSTGLLWQFSQSTARTFGLGFTPESKEPIAESHEDTVVSNPNPGENLLEEYTRQFREKYGTRTLDSPARKASDEEDSVVETRPVDMPKLIRNRETQTDEGHEEKGQDGKQSEEPYKKQSEPPTFSSKPLQMPLLDMAPPPAWSRSIRRLSVQSKESTAMDSKSIMSDVSQETVGKESETSVNEMSASRSDKVEKKKKKQEETAQLIRNLTDAIAGLMKKADSDSEE